MSGIDVFPTNSADRQSLQFTVNKIIYKMLVLWLKTRTVKLALAHPGGPGKRAINGCGGMYIQSFHSWTTTVHNGFITEIHVNMIVLCNSVIEKLIEYKNVMF